MTNKGMFSYPTKNREEGFFLIPAVIPGGSAVFGHGHGIPPQDRFASLQADKTILSVLRQTKQRVKCPAVFGFIFRDPEQTGTLTLRVQFILDRAGVVERIRDHFIAVGGFDARLEIV